MKKTLKYLWLGVAILLLFYAFDALVFGLMTPMFNPGLNTLTDRVMRAFISIVIAAMIIIYLGKND